MLLRAIVFSQLCLAQFGLCIMLRTIVACLSRSWHRQNIRLSDYSNIDGYNKIQKHTVTHAGDSRASGIICDIVSLWVCALRSNKRLELSTPNLVDIHCMAVTRHALNLRWKVKVTWLPNLLPASVIRAA